MEAKGLFGVTHNALLPMDGRAREIMGSLKIGDKVLVRVHKARNPEHHRLAFAVFQRIAEAKGVSVETVLTWLKVATGRIDFVAMPNGKMVVSPQSISFESMPQNEFQRFWEECWSVITEQLLPGLPEKEYEDIRALVSRDDARMETAA
jgi:hypothetical protein